MESSNSCYTPCLIDELMDTGVVNVDINLGVGSGAVTDFADHQKASPSHESDSGFSNMTSPCYSVSSADELDSVQGSDAPNYGIFNDLLDNDFVSYLCGDGQLSDPGSDEVSIDQSSLAPTTPTLEMCNSDHENNNSNLLCLENKCKSSRTKRMDSYPSDADTTNSSTIKEKKMPTVKVIKVIKSSPAITDTEKEIYNALEDRNRKNAVQAKLNREKKKVYIKSLEGQVEELKSENFKLRDTQEKLKSSKDVLEEEVAYLKSVLANQSALSKLLNNIPSVSNIKLSSSFMQRKRSAELDHDYQCSAKRSKKSTAGVCLHVDKDQVSLEFCSKCSSMSQQEV